MMETTCQHQVQRFSNNLGYHFVRCNASITRLNEGPCQYPQCGAAFGDPEHDIGVYVRDVLLPIPRHAYLGPLASECEKGHPVTDRDMRGISICHQNLGYHVYMAGPCFDTYEQAIKYRDYLDAKGIIWEPAP